MSIDIAKELLTAVDEEINIDPVRYSPLIIKLSGILNRHKEELDDSKS